MGLLQRRLGRRQWSIFVASSASVAQWIEPDPSKIVMRVRFLPDVPVSTNQRKN